MSEANEPRKRAEIPARKMPVKIVLIAEIFTWAKIICRKAWANRVTRKARAAANGRIWLIAGPSSCREINAPITMPTRPRTKK